jgi:hypothetical protein
VGNSLDQHDMGLVGFAWLLVVADTYIVLQSTGVRHPGNQSEGKAGMIQHYGCHQTEKVS